MSRTPEDVGHRCPSASPPAGDAGFDPRPGGGAAAAADQIVVEAVAVDADLEQGLASSCRADRRRARSEAESGRSVYRSRSHVRVSLSWPPVAVAGETTGVLFPADVAGGGIWFQLFPLRGGFGHGCDRTPWHNMLRHGARAPAQHEALSEKPRVPSS